MKSVVISIHPKWCELIASGKKTVEVRKTRPKIEAPFKCYIYMTAGDAVYPVTINGAPYTCSNVGGKCVIGEFVCDYISGIPMIGLVDVVDCEMSCLSAKEIIKYSQGKMLYGWHISNLVIYDKPKELSEFRKYLQFFDGIRTSELEEAGVTDIRLKRPPQSWCYVEGGAE